MTTKTLIALASVAVLIAACATTPNYEFVKGMPADIETRIAKAAKHPVGSIENPIRVHNPNGEYLYLSRMQCPNGRRPVFERTGSVGVGVYGHILDRYNVQCSGAQPIQMTVYMDMYFEWNVNNTQEPLPGFHWERLRKSPSPKAADAQ